MRTLSLTVMLLAVALAGCSEEPAKVVDGDEKKFDDLDLQSGKGAIRGIVVDPSITPIEGATIAIKSLEAEVKSNADGAFVFTDLEPGTYFLEVSRMGFSGAQTSVNVEAGVKSPPIVKVQLVPDASSLPFTQVLQFDGFIQCSGVAVVVSAAVCSFSSDAGVDLGDQFITEIPTDGFPDFVQGELVWKATQTLGNELDFNIYDGTLYSPYEQEGLSPQVIAGNRSFWEHGEGTSKDASPMETPGERLFLRVFAGSLDETENCNYPNAGVCLFGAGVTLQQSFTIYTTVFYRLVPDEGWMFVENGAHPVPGA